MGSGLLGPGPPVENYTEVIPLPGGDADVFTNAHPPWEPGEASRAVFGGFLIAHSVAAAHATVPTTFAPHSFQGVFLLPAKSTVPLHYHVERVADGRNFATRLVRLRQGDALMFVATVGLQKQTIESVQKEKSYHEKGERSGDSAAANRQYHQYALLMPDLGHVDPESLSRDRNQMLLDMGYPQKAIDESVADPFDWRHFSTTFGDEGQKDPSTCRVRSFVRAVHPMENNSPAAHLRSLAFLTDAYIVGYPALANTKYMRKNGKRLKMQASINHTILLHDAMAKADKWMVSEISTSWANHGRVLVQQRLWDWKTGNLILSCWQEGLVRLSGPKL